MRICRIATVPFFVRHHLAQQILATIRAGHEVHVVTSPEQQGEEAVRVPGAHYHPVRIERRIAPFADLAALVALWRYFRRTRFDVVHSTTPKAGLLCALAGAFAGVPLRLHTFTGQQWKEMRGPVRWISKLSDWVVVRLNTRCYADSASQKSFLVEQGIGGADDISVLGPGSLAGVDLAQYDIQLRNQRVVLRRELNISATSKVVAFVGRVTRDKGIGELVAAFESLQRSGTGDLVLLLIGPVEDSPNLMPPHLLRAAKANAATRLIGYNPHPERFLALADLFCLPSYREGFGNAVIEAAAMGLPVVATQIPGLTDSVVDGQTGILVPPMDAAALAAALGKLLSDDGLRERMGAAARLRAVEIFDAAKINALLLNEYAALSANTGQHHG